MASGESLDFEVTHYLRMSWHFQRYPSPSLSAPSPSSSPHGHGCSLPVQSPSLPLPSLPLSSGAKISPVVLFPIVILALVFLLSGLLHLLIKFLSKHPLFTRSSESNVFPEVSPSDDLQVQLRQLFHLHDSGLDQAFVDALPVFLFKEIIGDKEPFDCAVCLCEFSEKDKLRLLPLCGHGFHISCIDTWLLSNSTCPLCRGTLLSQDSLVDNPVFELDELRDEDDCSPIGENRFPSGQKVIETEEEHAGIGVFPVRLGKFRRSSDGLEEAGEGESSRSNLDARRCYSMGSYEYEVRANNLMVALCPKEISFDTWCTKGMERFEHAASPIRDADEEKKINAVSKHDSYSVSKIWLWSKAGNLSSLSNFDPIDSRSSLACMDGAENV